MRSSRSSSSSSSSTSYVYEPASASSLHCRRRSATVVTHTDKINSRSSCSNSPQIECPHVQHVTQAPREGASFITSQSELGVIRGGGGGVGGGGGWARIGGFCRLSPIWSWAKPCCQRGLFCARFRCFWVSGFVDVQRKNRPPLMLLMLVVCC